MQPVAWLPLLLMPAMVCAHDVLGQHKELGGGDEQLPQHALQVETGMGKEGGMSAERGSKQT